MIKMGTDHPVPMMIVGNKCDRKDKVISFDQVYQLSNQLGIRFFEVSAKTGENISAVFSTIGEILFESMTSSTKHKNKAEDLKVSLIASKLQSLHHIEKKNIFLTNEACFMENCKNKVNFHCCTKNCEKPICSDHIAEHLMTNSDDHQIKSCIKKQTEKEIEMNINLLKDLEKKNILLINELTTNFQKLINSIKIKYRSLLCEINEKNNQIRIEFQNLRDNKYVSDKAIYKYHDINRVEFEKINQSISKISTENAIFINSEFKSAEANFKTSKITIEKMNSLDVYDNFCVGNYIGMDLNGNEFCLKKYENLSPTSMNESLKIIEEEIDIMERLSGISNSNNCFLKYYGKFSDSATSMDSGNIFLSTIHW